MKDAAVLQHGSPDLSIVVHDPAPPSLITHLRRNRWRILAGVRLLGDATAIATSLVLVKPILRGGRIAAPGRWLGVSVLLWLLGLIAVGSYRPKGLENPTLELRQMLHGITLGAAIAAAVTFSADLPISRRGVFVAWVIALLTVGVERRALRKMVYAVRRRGRLRRRVLIVGADASGHALAESVRGAKWEGIDVVGFVTVNGLAPQGLRDGDVIVGSAERLRDLVLTMRVAEVMVAPSVAGNGHLAEVVAALDGVPVHLRIAPGVEGFLPSRIAVQPLGDRPLLAIERVELKPGARVAKRLLDLVLGTVMLVVAAPIIAMCMLAVRLDSRGPAFFRQRRVGLNGREFTAWKLRSMVVGADSQRLEMEDRNEAEGLLFKMRQDPRVTRVGRFLRHTSLDELPQLFNVLGGTMSLVGPRPPLRDEVARYGPQLHRRLLVKPGITGLWQVSGRAKLSFEDYVRYDLLYVQNWSIALDLYILCRTVPAVLSGRGAY